jgi:hypothetical protein
MTIPDPSESIEQAFKNAATVGDATARSGTLAVHAPKITHQELKIVETALSHPQERVDWISAVISVLSALFFIAKTLDDSFKAGIATFSSGTMTVLVVALVLFAVQLTRIISIKSKTFPFHSQALGYVSGLAALIPPAPDSALSPWTVSTLPSEVSQQGTVGQSRNPVTVSGHR